MRRFPLRCVQLEEERDGLEAVNKPGNVYIEDVMIKDHLQSC